MLYFSFRYFGWGVCYNTNLRVICMQMWTLTKFLIVTIMTIQFLCSCNNLDQAQVNNVKTKNSFKNTLVETQISHTNFYISLPSDYTITSKDGPDFSVYYFSPTDTTIKADFSGGLYFGNFPSEFEKDNDSCITTTLKSKILETNAEWTIYKCNSEYTLQTIIDSKSGEGWNARIHSFGNAKSEEEMYKVLDIYSTLKQRKK